MDIVNRGAASLVVVNTNTGSKSGIGNGLCGATCDAVDNDIACYISVDNQICCYKKVDINPLATCVSVDKNQKACCLAVDNVIPCCNNVDIEC